MQTQENIKPVHLNRQIINHPEATEMCIDANKDMTHQEMKQFIATKLTGEGHLVFTEYRLPNNKIADIFVVGRPHRTIIEVKTIFKISQMQEAYGKYNTCCERLVFATPPHPRLVDSIKSTITWQTTTLEKIGIWQVDWGGITVIREPRHLHQQ